MAMRWYVVHAYSNYEQAVRRSLIERVLHAEMHVSESFGRDEHNNVNVIVPSEHVTEMRDGRKKESERKLFPGYVLVQMEMNNESWHLVKETPKVLGFIGGTLEKPAPISDKEADTILLRVQEGAEKPRPKVLFEAGEIVRVTDGPFNDFNGVVEEVNYEKSRLRVAVLIFGRSTPVELEFSQVEKE